VYEPGDRLTEERLAVDFGVSRNPVREAIRVLEAKGFLLAQPRRGAVVARMSVQERCACSEPGR
jgi:DNA-binding GntR family transcriptional regulator